ncbi:MAG: hypothetical protein ACHREM_29345 [Polyangiales bacterium]
MISRRTWFTWLGASVLFATSAGCGHPWIVVKAAAPSPLVGVKTFAVEAVHFEGMTVGAKSEAEYVAGKTPEQAASWQADKATMNDAYFSRISEKADGFTVAPAPAPDAGTFIVRAFITHWEPGYYVGVSGQNSDADMTVQLVGPAGVVDEISLHVEVSAGLFNPSTGGRIRSAAEHFGAITSKYIASRVSP